MDSETIVCILCKEELSFSINDTTVFYNHIQNYHQVKFLHNLVMAINFLDDDTMNRIVKQYKQLIGFEYDSWVRSGLDSQDSVELESAIYATPIQVKLKLIPVFEHMHHDAQTAALVRQACFSMLPSYPGQDFIITLRTLTSLAKHTLVDIPDQDPRKHVRAALLLDLHNLAGSQTAHLWTKENVSDDMVQFASSSPWEAPLVAALTVLIRIIETDGVYQLELMTGSPLMKLCESSCYSPEVRVHQGHSITCPACPICVAFLIQRLGPISNSRPSEHATFPDFAGPLLARGGPDRRVRVPVRAVGLVLLQAQGQRLHADQPRLAVQPVDVLRELLRRGHRQPGSVVRTSTSHGQPQPVDRDGVPEVESPGLHVPRHRDRVQPHLTPQLSTRCSSSGFYRSGSESGLQVPDASLQPRRQPHLPPTHELPLRRPMPFPRFFYQSLKQTRLKLAVTPQPRAAGEPVAVNTSQMLAVKVEGVIERGGSELDDVSGVVVQLTCGLQHGTKPHDSKIDTNVSLEQEAEPQ